MRNMQKICPQGHYYDGNRFSSCPYCKRSNSNGTQGNLDSTQPLRNTKSNNISNNRNSQQDKTVAMDRIKDTEISPVVGWLICTEGGDKGKDFRLHAGNNFVGRNSDRDVCIHGDASVSGKHFSISCDSLNDRYFATMGEGRAIVYINGSPISGSNVTLNKGDKIKAAHTTLVFIPLETKYVKWDFES